MPQRVWQAIAVLLALVLVVIGGITAAVFLSRTANQSPRPTATATPRPTPSPSPSGSPGPSEPAASPSGSPTESPGESSGEPSPSEQPTEEPNPSPSEGPTPRGELTTVAFLSDTNGGALRLCLYRGTPDDIRTTPLCFDGRRGFVRAVAPGPGRGQWTVVVNALTGGSTPSTSVEVTHRTRQRRKVVEWEG